MTATPDAVPMTAAQIRARMDGIAPWPAADDPHPARSLARHFAVQAESAWQAWMYEDFPANLAALDQFRSGFTIVTLLARMAAVPYVAALAAREIGEALTADGLAGELLAGHLADLGIDQDEIERLNDAARTLRQAGEAEVTAEIFTAEELTAAMEKRAYSPEHRAELLAAIRRDRETGGPKR